MKIDLWTKDMTIEEMKQFFHQTLLTLADTFERATGEHLISEDLRDYCYHFADKMNILPNNEIRYSKNGSSIWRPHQLFCKD